MERAPDMNAEMRVGIKNIRNPPGMVAFLRRMNQGRSKLFNACATASV
jgi:hypothetical protein